MVAFLSTAMNLDPRDQGSAQDVYVHDRLTKTGTLVSERVGQGASAQGCYGLSISADGRFVAFECLDDNVIPGDNNLSPDVFVRDLCSQTTELISVGPMGQQANRESLNPSISGDGRFVAFVSAATIWFRGAPGNFSGVFVRDRHSLVTLAATRLPSGGPSAGVCFDPSISADGRFVAYEGSSPELVPGQPYTAFGSDFLRWDRLTGST
jgi:Tol biopolymer transport system component